MNLAKWTWKGVRQYLQEQFEVALSSRTCLNYLHRLGFVLKRPKKRLVKANAEKRRAFIEEYVALRRQAQAEKAVNSGRKGSSPLYVKRGNDIVEQRNGHYRIMQNTAQNKRISPMQN